MDDKYFEIIMKVIIPLLTTTFGLYQIKKRYDLEGMLKMKTWNLHKHIALLLGDVQRTRDNILQTKTNEALVSVGNAEGQSQALLKETALLVCHYEKPSYSLLDQWIAIGKVDNGYKHMFLPFASKENIFVRLITFLKKFPNKSNSADR